MEIDVEKFAEKKTDEELAQMILAGRDEETVHGALNELARRNSPLQLDVFREVLDDPAQSLTAKRTVAARIGTVGNVQENQELLLRHLTTEDPLLFARIAQALGRLGDREALERLEAAEAPDDPVAIRALEFAMTLLSYRLRLERHVIPPPPDTALVPVRDETSFKVEPVDERSWKQALERLSKDLPSIAATPAAAVKLICGSIELLLLLTAEFADPAALDTLSERPALPLVMLKKAESLDRYYMDRYLFTQPSKDRNAIDLLGTRPSGELTYAGKVHPSPGGFSFTLGSVDTRYAPAIDVAGEYDAKERTFELTRTRTSTRIAAEQHKPAQPRRASSRPR